MKKLVSIVLALVFSMALFTGCVSGKDDSQSQPTPTPTPVGTPTMDDEEDPNYPVVLAMWTDMDGYWVNAAGEYMHFTLNENGKAVLYTYDKDGNLTAFGKTTAVTASNKTAYGMEFNFPAISGDEKYPGLTQKEGTDSMGIEVAGYGDGYVELTDSNGNTVQYVYVGENLDKLEDAIETAKGLE